MKLKKINFLLCFLFITLASCKTSAQIGQTPTKSDIEQQIIGTWLLENDPNTKIVFTGLGDLKHYYNNVLESTDQYVITNQCGGETHNHFFLKTTTQNGSVFCAYLENVDYENSDKLVLMTQNQGKIIVYDRQ